MSDSKKEGNYSSFHETFFSIVFVSQDITVEVNYSDLQLDVLFYKEKITTTYLLIDKNLYANASGMGGNMFSDVQSAIHRIAQDI